MTLEKFAIAAAVGLASVVALPAEARDAPRRLPDGTTECARVGQTLYDSTVSITSVTAIGAVSSGANAAPAYCDVRGTIRGNIKFAVWLPQRGWNGRFQMVGGGGKAGTISFDAMLPALRLGYASSSTDTGHDASSPTQGGSRFGNDALFGKELEIDFGHRAVHLTAQVSKAVIRAYYGEDAHHSYWVGCSTGGRQGMMESQRYPDDFDGFVTGDPVYNYTGQQMGAPAWLTGLYNRIPPSSPADGPKLSPAKRALLGNIVYNGNGADFQGCDVADGLKDGQIRDPQTCSFDLDKHVPACAPGQADTSACLTADEKNAARAIYTGHVPWVLGLPVGSENIPGGWSTWLLPNSGTPQLHSVVADAFEWLMFTPDRPGFNYLTQFNWDTDPQLMDGAAAIFNATDPDLRDVLFKGKKMIMYHGFADPGANPLRTIGYRQSVIDFMANQYGNGAAAVGEALTDEFLKVYMIPGMAHCSGGVGHSNVDYLTPLVDWVENGNAPKEIIGTKPGTTSTRPHCPYPQVAVYNGVGNPEVAASFACQKPAAR